MQTSLGIGLGVTEVRGGGGAAATYHLLQETGDALLLETGDYLLTEDSP